MHEKSSVAKGRMPFALCVFDLLVMDGKRIMNRRLTERKDLLAELLWPLPKNLLVVTAWGGKARELVRDAVLPLRLEGLVAKREGSVYVPGVRTGDWVKVKCEGAVPSERFRRR